MNRFRMFWMLILVTAAIGCRGTRITVLDEQTPEGIWSTGDTLVRVYDGMDLQKAIDGVDAYVKSKKWKLEDRDIDLRDAEIEVEDAQGLQIDFKLWAPKAKPYVEVGVEVGSGDPRRSAEILNELEKHLPGKRLKGRPE